MGITQARHAQQFVMNHLMTPDPAEGLAGEGIKVRRELLPFDVDLLTGRLAFTDSGEPL
jgi:hypothetical protein